MTTRKTNVMGSFYPSDENEVKKYFKTTLTEKQAGVRAVIAPHAGYIYSGETANLAYSRISQDFERVIVIGPSHKVAFKGGSVALFEKYETPLGDMEIDLNYSQKIISKYNYLGFNETIHKEHSTETQMPFIKHYFPNTKVVEIVYGRINFAKLADIIQYILTDRKNLLVISSDLSHFYSLEKANEIDKKSIKAIEAVNPTLFTEDCEACGGVGIKALLSVGSKMNLKSQIIDYRTSYNINNDATNVVGYLSALVS